MKKLILVIYTILLVPIWGLTFLDVETSTSLSTFLGITFTLYSYYLIRNSGLYSIRYANLIIISGPFFYLLAVLFIKPVFSLQTLFSPILWAFLLLVSLTFIKEIEMKKVGFYFIFAAYLYAFHLYPTYKRLIGEVRYEDLTIKIDPTLKKNVSIESVPFLNAKNEAEKISLDGRPILVETWNEKCGPCIKSIDRLESFIERNLKFRHIYLYEKFGENNLKPTEVFGFKKIQDSTKILIDIDNTFFNKIGMHSYPYFLVFSPQGEFVDHFVGYNDAILNDIQAKLLQLDSQFRVSDAQ